MLALRHRVLIALPLMAIAIAAGTYLAAHYGPTLSRELHQSTTVRAREAPAGRNAHRHPRVVRPPRAAPHRANASIHTLLVGLAITWTGAIAFAVIGLALTVRRRFANRLRRHYERYPLNLTMHDEAKPKDLDDMIEAIANAIRPPLQTRWRDGQPFIAIELIYRRDRARAGVDAVPAVRARGRPDARGDHRPGLPRRLARAALRRAAKPPSTRRCPFPVTCCGCESAAIICIRCRDRSNARRAGSASRARRSRESRERRSRREPRRPFAFS